MLYRQMNEEDPFYMGDNPPERRRRDRRECREPRKNAVTKDADDTESSRIKEEIVCIILFALMLIFTFVLFLF